MFPLAHSPPRVAAPFQIHGHFPIRRASLLAAQSVTVTPSSLSFGNQALSITSTAKTVTLKNGTSGSITISSISASGDYAQTNSCGNSMAAGANCTISVTFTPTATGSRTGALTITDTGSNSPQTVSLSGTGVLQATVSPTSLSFGSRAVATTSTTQGSYAQEQFAYRPEYLVDHGHRRLRADE